MRSVRLALAIVIAVGVVGGLGHEARAGGGGDNTPPPCLVAKPMGKTLKGTVAMELLNYDGQFADVDVTASLERGGDQAVFRAYFPGMTIPGLPAALACQVLDPFTGGLEPAILAAFGFTGPKYHIVITLESITNTDGFQPIPGTDRLSTVAHIRMYVTKK